VREEEINGLDELEANTPNDVEEEMNQMFDQSILHPEGAAIGRLSLKRNPGDFQADELSLEFDTVSQSTAASDKSN